MGSSSLFVSGAMLCASGAALRIALKIARIIAMMDSSFTVCVICAIYFYCYIFINQYHHGWRLRRCWCDGNSNMFIGSYVGHGFFLYLSSQIIRVRTLTILDYCLITSANLLLFVSA